MSIVIRLPEADDATAPAYEPSVTRQRHGGGTADMTSPSADLLPTGGAPARDPAPVPGKVLALDALRLLMAFRGHRTPGIRWSDPAFRAEVEAVWRQLAPLRSRRALADSFAREASQRDLSVSDVELSAVRLAYAFRWLELRPRSTPDGRGKVLRLRVPEDRSGAVR